MNQPVFWKADALRATPVSRAQRQVGIAPVAPQTIANWPRHLVYHLYPIRDSVWERNLAELRLRADLFTGRKIIYAACDERTVSAADVQRALDGYGADVRIVRNQSTLGEAWSLISAIEELADQPGITFYAHAKGVTHHDTSVIFDVWTRLMYTLLDRRQEVWDLLSRHGFCGLVRAAGQPVAEGQHQWHFPGSFYWFRNDVVRQRGCKTEDVTRFYCEQFPSRVVRFIEAAALYPDLMLGNPYSLQSWLPYLTAAPQSQIGAEGTRPVRVPGPLRTPPPVSHASSGTSSPISAQASALTVCVVVTSHNYGRFLGEAIQSALRQSYRVQEILVVDDASDDNTQEVAESFAPQGVRYLRVDVKNSHQARHAGFLETTADIVLFLDADNWLPPDYIATGLREFEHRNVGVVYADLQKFGHENGRTDFPAYSRAGLMQNNFVDTSALIRRSALEITDAFQRSVDPLRTPEDHLLFQRLAVDGWDFRKQPVALMYRTHGAQQSRRAQQLHDGRHYSDAYCLLQQDVTLFIPLSGRDFAWEAQRQFLERQAWPHDRIRLILCDSSQHAEFSQRVREWVARCDYPDVRHQLCAPAPRGLADANRRNRQTEREVQLAMCRIYNRLKAALEADYCWILEDDVIPPDDVLARLMSRFEPDVGCVCAPYPSRWDPDYVVWTADSSSVNGHVVRARKPGPLDSPVQEVRGSGFGCLIVRGALLQRHIFQLPRGEVYYDQHFFRTLGDHWRRLCDWTTECEHLGVRPGALPVPPPPCVGSTLSPSERPMSSRTLATAGINLGDVAVVLLSHNYGRFLDESIQSVLNQTHAPREVLVVDDSSTDDTAAVALKYADRGVKYARIDARDVNQTRWTGLNSTTSEFVVFLDADDLLPRSYLASGLPYFSDPCVAVVYSDMQRFGDRSDLIVMPAFDERSIHWQNFIHAASIVRRSALIATDAFRNLPDMTRCAHHNDWALWRRVLVDGRRAAKQPTPLHYRKHGENWLNRGLTAVPSYYDRAALWQEPLTIFLSLSGREDATNDILNWLDRQSYPHEYCRLVICDTSQDDGFTRRVHQRLAASDYRDIRLMGKAVGVPRLADQERRNAPEVCQQVREAMWRIYGTLSSLETEYILTLEDDVLPPLDAIDRLLRGFDETVFSVAAPYRSRFGGWIAWDRPHQLLAEPRAGWQPTQGCGFGCTILRRSVLQKFVIGPYKAFQDYDIALYHWLSESGRWRALINWDCRAVHSGLQPYDDKPV